jgi:enoyl-CoA hydratase
MSERVDLETVHYEPVADGVVRLTLNRPDQGNAVVPEMARDLTQVLSRLDADRSVRVLILTGAGRHFCSGADLVALERYLSESQADEQEPFNARVLFPVTQRLTLCRFPILAAVNGAATAGGLDLALACDIRIAAASARMGETYIRIGLSPGNGGSYFLPRLIGSGLAAELALTGDIIDANRALEIGLVNRVVEPDKLQAVTLEMATRIASFPRLALEATKQQLRHSWHSDLAGSMNESFWSIAALHYSDDLREGVAAAREKRAPHYNAPRRNKRK